MKLSQSVYSYHYQQSWSQGLLLYAEIAVFFPSGSRNHRQYSLRLFTERWPGWVGLGCRLHSDMVCSKAVTSTTVKAAQRIEQRWSGEGRPRRHHWAKPPEILRHWV